MVSREYIKASNADSGDYFGSSYQLIIKPLWAGVPRRFKERSILMGPLHHRKFVILVAKRFMSTNGNSWAQEAYIKTQDSLAATILAIMSLCQGT